MLAPKSLSSPQNAAITAGGTPYSFSAAANAFCFNSARKRSNDMPLWHAAPPRHAGAAAGLGAVVTGRGLAAGRAGAVKGCCAKAADESTNDAAMAAIAIREANKGIEVTGWQKISLFRISQNPPKRKSGASGAIGN